MKPERVILVRPSTVLQVAMLLLGMAIALWIVWVARQVITWVLVSAFLALALNPAVALLQSRGIKHRAAAAGVIYLLAILALAGLGWLLVPPLVEQVSGFGDAVPGYVHQLTAGQGPLGFLERDYHVVETLVKRCLTVGAAAPSSSVGAGTVVSLTRSVVTGVVGFVTIVFLTFFMILEGPG